MMTAPAIALTCSGVNVASWLEVGEFAGEGVGVRLSPIVNVCVLLQPLSSPVKIHPNAKGSRWTYPIIAFT